MRVRTCIPAAAAAALCALPASAGAALPTGNLLKNPGAEQSPVSGVFFDAAPIPGWETSPGFRAVDVPAPDEANLANMVNTTEVAAGGGCRLFMGGFQPTDPDADGATYFTAQQTVDVPAEAAGKTLYMGGVLGAQENDPDTAGIYIELFNAAGDSIGNREIAGPANDVNQPVGSPLNSTRFVHVDESAPLPAGVAKIAVALQSTAKNFDLGTFGTLTNGYLDNAYISFDGPPAAPDSGCRPPAVTTGDATNVAVESAKLAGTVDAHGEESEWVFRIGKSADVSDTTPSSTFGTTSAADPIAVSGEATGLEPSTTYYYRLEATSSYAKDADRARGQVRSFTTPARPGSGGPNPNPGVTPRPDPVFRFDTFATAVKISKPKGGCVKKGTTFKVTVRDASMGVRTLRRFIVQAGTGIGNAKQTKGRVGVVSSTVTVKKIPTKAPKNTRGAKLILTVIADFNEIAGTPAGFSSGQSISGSKQFKFCKKKRR